MENFDKPIFDVHVNVDYAYCQVMEGLFLGAEVGANSKLIFEKHNIKRVLSLGIAMEPAFPDKCDYMTISIEDSRNEDIYQFFENTYKYIDKAISDKAPIFVHCQAGISRSASVVIAYFIKKYKWTYLEALSFVSENRDFINPNKGFEKQLIEYQLRCNTGVISDKRFKKNINKHIRSTKVWIEKTTKNIKLQRKSKKSYKIKKVLAENYRLEVSSKDNCVIKFTRLLGEKMMEWNHLPKDIQKTKLIEFAKKPKNYLENIIDIPKNKSKKEVKKLKDNTRRLLKHKSAEIIESFFSSTFIEDKKQLKENKKPTTK